MNDLHQLCRLIDAGLASQDRVLLAIDGCCTAGKTTLAAALAARYDSIVFHMDDFFLRPEQRTPQRLAEVGGNVDYERFRQEVLTPLLAGTDFRYRPYNCKTGLLADPIAVSPKPLCIIEGSYSTHPFFGRPYDLTVFLSVSPETQHARILRRPVHLHQRFFREWIPMEQQYFQSFSIVDACDLSIYELSI